MYEKIALFANTKAFKKNKRLLSNLQNSKRNILSDIDNIEKRYNTSLFEKLSSLNDNSYKTIKKKYYKLLEKEKNIDIQIKGIKKVSSYKGYQAYVKFVNDNTKMVKEELNTYKLWQPFISFLYLLKFTLPLLILSFLLYRFSTSVHRVASISTKLTALISSHIIIITLLPIAINIMYLIYHVIPQRFLKSVIDALYQFGFIFLGYYFLMLIGIITLGAIIFLIQRGVSQRENLRRKIKEKTLYIDAYNQKQCPHCKNRVDYSKNYCGYCSEGLHRECHSCKKKTPKQIEYCMECGEKELSI